MTVENQINQNSNDLVLLWLQGAITGVDSAGKLKRPIRDYLLSEAGNKCSRCGWNKPNPVRGEPILVVNRKDGNRKNTQCGNLEVLCWNCLSLTPYFGALNRGKTISPNSVFSRKNWENDD